MQLFYSEDYVAAAYAFDTTRKSRRIAESLRTHPIAGVEIVEPAPLTIEGLCEAHDSAYVNAVRTGEPANAAASQGFQWDPGLWTMVLASNGGVVAAARSAMTHGVSGSLSSGLHHARRGRGAGFCTFNGLAIAAKTALRDGAESVLILDLDAHCGGGTHSLVADEERIWHTDVSVDGFDSYAPSPRNTIVVVREASAYLPTVERELERLHAEAPAFSLCLYNAGVDPYEGCSTGGMSGITGQVLQERERIVFDWCASRHIPVAFVLAGGYAGDSLSESELVELHRRTIAAAIRALRDGRAVPEISGAPLPQRGPNRS